MSKPYRVLITGSRKWLDCLAVYGALKEQRAIAAEQGRPLIVVHGACPTGADLFADEWAQLYGFTVAVVHGVCPTVADERATKDGNVVERHPADWSRYGKSAGPRRNAEMVEAGAEVCIAFPLGVSIGTMGCVRLAERAGIPVILWAA